MEDATQYDSVSAIMAFEQGELDREGTLELFAYLIRTGLAWKLQGSYGRAAQHMIAAGLISRAGDINPEYLDR